MHIPFKSTMHVQLSSLRLTLRACSIAKIEIISVGKNYKSFTLNIVFQEDLQMLKCNGAFGKIEFKEAQCSKAKSDI